MRCGNEGGGCEKGGGRLLPKGRQECDYSSGVAALVASTSRCRLLIAAQLERLKRHRAMQARRLVASGWVQCREVQQGEAGAVANPIDRERTVVPKAGLHLVSAVTQLPWVDSMRRDALILHTKIQDGLLPVSPSRPGSSHRIRLCCL